MKRRTDFIYYTLFAILILCQSTVFGQKKYEYQSFPNDPYNTRIYTLDNGLTVYLSPYAEEPRIQTYVAVRVGSMHDPAETTGLAHYFEHLMFKGTSTFGTTDWEKEKPLLDKIESLFEVYRNETDLEKRKKIYKEIDSISYVASGFAIPNEYDRLMTAIGSTGTNAFTSNDFTAYIENIPSNQVKNWAKIQAQRFSDPVLRLFHTELETVYEEKNMSLTNDGRQANEAMYRGLFPKHSYGLQTTLGDAEHLKNPSIINIKNFFEQYYVPNNIAVIMSGDFDPDEVIVVIDEYFGKLKPRELPKLNFPAQPDITEPKVMEVIGLQAENVMIGWRFDGINSDQMPILNMIRMILSNGRAGLIDQNLNKPLKILGGGAGVRNMIDYSVFMMAGRNQRDQSLDEVKNLLFEQIELLKKGEFPDWLMEAALNNLRLQEMRSAESIGSRASILNFTFLNKRDYEDIINYIDILGNITKEDIMGFAQKHLSGDNYVIVYKRQGKPDVEQVDKPAITPIQMNRDSESPLLQKVKTMEIEPIQPVFLDYKNDITKGITRSGLEVLYAENTTNPTFSLTYHWEKGSYNDKVLPLAGSFINYLGTDKLSTEEISNEFYKLACTFSVSVGEDETTISISGLSENLEEAMKLFEDLVWSAQPDEEALKRYVATIKKARSDGKADQRTVFSALVSYATYGEHNPDKFTLNDEELDKLTSAILINALRELWSDQHKVVFYGPQSLRDLIALVEKNHKNPAKLNPAIRVKMFTPNETTTNKVYFTHYDANQSYLQTVSKGKKYDIEMFPLVRMYNMYFGGGMNAIVFQEMREKRGLAYTARGNYSTPSWPDENYMNTSFIATQNDKIVDAFTAFNELFDEMPLSETSFNLAKEQLISNIRTQRIRNVSVIWNYLNARKMGHTEDPRIRLYKELPGFTLQNVKEFNEKYVKGKPKTYVILGNESLVNFEEVEKLFGPVKKLDRDELFVY
jgi:predicted Zn-dependent peptidase